MKLNVNTDETVAMTNRLEKLHRSAFPSAVRGTLNKAAFHTKQKTLLSVTQKTFTTRQKNFFRANSRVEVAKGFDVRKMVAVIGMTEKNLRGEDNYAVKNLEQQERGGSIGGRSMIPISIGARTSKSIKKNVRKKQRLSSIRNVIDARNTAGKSNSEKYIKSAIRAGVGGYVLSPDEKNGQRILFQIKRISGGRIEQTPIYTYKKGRKIKVESTHFMERSGEMSGKKMALFYKQEGERQIQRLMNKR